MLRPLARLEDTLGLRLTLIGIDADGTCNEDAFERTLQRKPRLVAFNHVSNVTGRIQPIASMFERARKSGAITLLDASQSLGHLPVDARELNADMIAFTGHKGLRGPAGTGGLYIAPGLDLKQVFVGGTGFRSDMRLHPSDMPTRLEAGTPNVPALAGLAAALRWHEENGGHFRDMEKSREIQLREGLREIQGVHIFGDTESEKSMGSFRPIEGWGLKIRFRVVES